jgi:hypothetical protein
MSDHEATKTETSVDVNVNTPDPSDAVPAGGVETGGAAAGRPSEGGNEGVASKDED